MLIFYSRPRLLWPEALKRMGHTEAFLSSVPGEVTVLVRRAEGRTVCVPWRGPVRGEGLAEKGWKRSERGEPSWGRSTLGPGLRCLEQEGQGCVHMLLKIWGVEVPQEHGAPMVSHVQVPFAP